MKQRITIEQLNELSDDQKSMLHKWRKPQKGDFYAWSKNGSKVGDESFMVLNITDSLDDPESSFIALPLLSIGQMTQFLYEETNDWGIHYNDSGVCFYVYLSWTLDTAGPGRKWMNDELCDALWEAVKEVLRESASETTESAQA